METDQEFFNKPTCLNCGSPHVYTCPYCMSKKDYEKIVRNRRLERLSVIAASTFVPLYLCKRLVRSLK
jgi:hypothetical protein